MKKLKLEKSLLKLISEAHEIGFLSKIEMRVFYSGVLQGHQNFDLFH
jgi:hypothetical protein